MERLAHVSTRRYLVLCARLSAQLATMAFVAMPSLALATQACPEGTHPNRWWVALPVCVVLLTCVLAWRVYKFKPGLWGAVGATVLCALGLPLALLALIIPAPCVR